MFKVLAAVKNFEVLYCEAVKFPFCGWLYGAMFMISLPFHSTKNMGLYLYYSSYKVFRKIEEY